MKKILIFSFLFLVVSVSASFAVNEPYVISFQGKLDPVPTSLPTITFRLYKDSGATQYTGWAETITGVPVDANGIFNVFLGQTNSLEAVILNNTAGLWLQIKVENDTLSPAQALTAAPFAIAAKNLRDGNIVFEKDTKAYPNAAANEGMMRYHDTRKRAAYSDGDKWIEIDPVYTSNTYKTMYLPSVTAQQKDPDNDVMSATGALTGAPNDIIITNIGYSNIEGGPTNAIVKIVVFRSGGGQPTQVLAKYFTSIDFYSGNYWVSKMANFTLPIPVKVEAGFNVSVGVGIADENGTPAGSATVRGLYINYIDLPL